MATEAALTCISKPVAANYSAKQYFFMKINSSGQAVVCGDGEAAVGVLQDDPAAANRAGSIGIAGQTKISIGATLTEGDEVASDASGEAVPAATGDHVLGICTEGGANGVIGSMIFAPRKNSLG